jgi:two-component system, NtrC family, sensor kinase
MPLVTMQPSLRKKITYGYVAVALFILGISLFAFLEFRLIEEKIYLGERITTLFDTALEIRRFERNYFLHGQAADVAENHQYVAELGKLLHQDRPDVALIGAQQRVNQLQTDLHEYDHLMTSYAAAVAQYNHTTAVQLEERIRTIGKRMVTAAADMLNSERQLVGRSLAKLRNVLMIAIIAVAILVLLIGLALSRRVVQPLSSLAHNVDTFSRGKRDSLSLPSQDREVVSIITAFNHMLKELDVRQKHLLRSEKLASLGTLLSGVAHELNNPLSNIWSSCQILQEELQQADIAYQRELLGQIDEQCQRARHIVRSLLDFARDRQFSKESQPLLPLIEQTLRFIRREIPAGVTITTHIAADISIDADKQRIQQVFMNLLLNALDAAGAQGRIEIRAKRHFPGQGSAADVFGHDCLIDHPAIDISIKDNGPGIAADVLPRIFDPFFTTKDVGKGMGLGLFIVYEIIEEHGGCITVTSTAGQGSSFYLRLPQESAPAP